MPAKSLLNPTGNEENPFQNVAVKSNITFYDNGLQPIVWDENASEPKDIEAAEGKEDLQQAVHMAGQPDDKDQD